VGGDDAEKWARDNLPRQRGHDVPTTATATNGRELKWACSVVDRNGRPRSGPNTQGKEGECWEGKRAHKCDARGKRGKKQPGKVPEGRAAEGAGPLRGSPVQEQGSTDRTQPYPNGVPTRLILGG